MTDTKEKFSTVFEKLSLSDGTLEVFGNAFVTYITVNKNTMVMNIGLEVSDIIPKTAERTLKESLLSEFRSISDVIFDVTFNFPAEDVFGDTTDSVETIELFD